MRNIACIYHHPCLDGFTAAWVVKKYAEQKEADFMPIEGVYQKPPALTILADPAVTDIMIVDFSYSRSVMEEIIALGKPVYWIDHHKTAIDAMEPVMLNPPKNFTAYISTHACGAMLAWHYLFQRSPPRMLEYIDDRDLWVFQYPDTRWVNASLFSYKYDFMHWNELMHDDMIPKHIEDGRAIDRKHLKDIHELLPMTVHFEEIDGHSVPVSNMPYTMASDAAQILCESMGYMFAATYYENAEGYKVYSLRSRKGSADVAAIAKKYGGGGHVNAAGFKIHKSASLQLSA